MMHWNDLKFKNLQKVIRGNGILPLLCTICDIMLETECETKSSFLSLSLYMCVYVFVYTYV